LKFGQYQPMETEDIRVRRRIEEQYRNQAAHAEAQKADLLKKQRKIQECQEQIRRMDRYAERCLLEGEEKKASVYLERKVEWQERLEVLIHEAGFLGADTSIFRPNELASEDICEASCQESGKTE